jgi:hypothetical protein
MSNMIRGLPMQASSTQQYAAAPNQLSQAIGTIGSGASIYNAFNPTGTGRAAGGEIKGYAKGGIMSYDMGGEVEAQLKDMDEKGLEAQARESSSPSIRRMAQRILRERQMSEQPKGASAMGIQYQAPAVPSMRGGGIIAFAKGNTVYGGPSSENDPKYEEDAKIGMAERLAKPAPTEGGILGAGPVTAAPTTPVPTGPAKPSPFIDKEAMAQRDLFTAQANRSTEDVIKEIQADRRALGVDTSEARDKYRSEQMAERASMKDEQERQKHLRLAEFFASWGSTPGPTLVAGMNALKQSIPGIVSDEKEAKKARREADKIIYDIDEATRLEKLGLYDKATALKEKAAGRAEDYNKYLLTLQASREANERAIEAANIQAKSSKYTADTHAAATKNAAANTERRIDEVARNNFQTQALQTKRAVENLESQIAKEAKDSMEYANAKRQVNITKISKEQRAKAQETVDEYDKGWTDRRRVAKEDNDLAQQQLREINERLGYGKKKPDNSGGGGSAADRPSIASFQR